MPQNNQKGLAPLIFVIIAAVIIVILVVLSKGNIKQQPGGQTAQQTESPTNSDYNKDTGVKQQTYTSTGQKNETTKDEIKGVPKPVSEFMDNKDITKLETGGLSVNKGDNPPNIEGTYKADNFIATYVSLVREKTIKVGETITKGAGVVAYSNQKDDGSIDIDSHAEGLESRSTSISGKDNCFTIYVEENFNESNCKYILAFVESGCKVDKGLANFQISSLMKSKTGEGCDDVAPVGYTIVGKEEDGLLEKMK